jgi:potassium-transporting ATPase KdpC subunit
MLRILSRSLLLLGLTVIICCGVYPLAVWAIGKAIFPFQADGSLLKGPDGSIVGSKLIAQPFTKDEYFQPRPSAASYDATASASSTYAASNYLLRNRVATTLGPIVRYKSGPKAGHLVAPDIEAWFQQDQSQGAPHLVAQWADLHNAVAQAWVTGDPTHGQYVDAWSKAHPDLVAKWIKENPATPQPKASDLAVPFFENFSNDHPGMFPSAVTQTGADGKSQTSVQPVKEGSDIQANFFDMWRQDHPDADLQDVPGDLVTASGSGLDPHITLENAEFQLDRVAAKWADNTKRDEATVHAEIDQVLQKNAVAPFGGLAGEKLVNVLEVNLELCKLYGTPK